jgi:hypothetical protein
MKLLLYTFSCSEPFVIIYHVFVNVFFEPELVIINAGVTLSIMAHPHVSGLTCLASPLPSSGPSMRRHSARDLASRLWSQRAIPSVHRPRDAHVVLWHPSSYQSVSEDSNVVPILIWLSQQSLEWSYKRLCNVSRAPLNSGQRNRM